MRIHTPLGSWVADPNNDEDVERIQLFYARSLPPAQAQSRVRRILDSLKLLLRFKR